MFKFAVLLAIVFRLILMPTSAHSDLFFINMFPNLFLTQGVINIGSHMQSEFGSRNYTYYSQMTYSTFALFQLLYTISSETFSPWMTSLYNLEKEQFAGQATGFITATSNHQILRDLFLAKMPYLLFDLASVFVLWKFVKKKMIRKTVIILWLFNPVSLYASYMMGQFDIIPVFFTLTGFYFLNKSPKAAFLIFGVAAAFKIYALLFMLPVAIIYGATPLQRLKLITFGLIPLFIFSVPTIVDNLYAAIYQIIPKVYLGSPEALEGWPLYSQIIKYFLLVSAYLLALVFSYKLRVKNLWFFALSVSLISILLILAIAPRISFHYLLWPMPLVLLWFKDTKVAGFILIVQGLSLA